MEIANPLVSLCYIHCRNIFRVSGPKDYCCTKEKIVHACTVGPANILRTLTFCCSIFMFIVTVGL